MSRQYTFAAAEGVAVTLSVLPDRAMVTSPPSALSLELTKFRGPAGDTMCRPWGLLLGLQHFPGEARAGEAEGAGMVCVHPQQTRMEAIQREAVWGRKVRRG